MNSRSRRRPSTRSARQEETVCRRAMPAKAEGAQGQADAEHPRPADKALGQARPDHEQPYGAVPRPQSEVVIGQRRREEPEHHVVAR